jgi:prephenate dehydrogenase
VDELGAADEEGVTEAKGKVTTADMVVMAVTMEAIEVKFLC